MSPLPQGISRDRAAVVVALVAPFVVTVALVPFRDHVSNTNAALLLVLVIVVVAASGSRLAGLLCAVSAAIWFDFFLTKPYQTFEIMHRDDIETNVLLLAVGIGVSEIAQWGRRQQARAEREAGYLEGIRAAAEAVASPRAADSAVRIVSEELVRVLELDECRFEHGVAGVGRPARLRHDGQVEWHGRQVDIERDGLPDTAVELLVENNGQLVGRFVMTAPAGSRPTAAQRLVAVTMADQVGAALG